MRKISNREQKRIWLLSESKEIGDQRYYNIIKDQAKYIETLNLKEIVDKVLPTDVLIYPGRYNTSKVMKDLSDFKGQIHIDLHYDYEGILDNITTKLSNIILSTSSSLFKNQFNGRKTELINYFKDKQADYLLLKENRGGSFCYSFVEDISYESPAYYIPTMHSVGVGDVYNAIFISYFFIDDIERKMRFASHCAARYAETMSYEKFEYTVKVVLENIDEMLYLEGFRLSWEERQDKNIYLAAPDFPNVNVTILSQLSDCLTYHNFNPRLPIRENGLVESAMMLEEEIKIYHKDLELLDICDLLIAVLLTNDPGILVELGNFAQRGKPTIILDPYDLCTNMFVRHTATYLCKNIEEVIGATYQCLKRR